MGLFDRLRLGARRREEPPTTTAVTPGQDALRLIDEGNAIENEGRFQEALARYEAAIRLAPNLARAYLNRGNALLALGDTEGALGAYATALVHDPNYAAAHFNLGNAYVRSGRHEDALVAYRRALALKPDFADAEVALGALYDDLGQRDDAAASYRRALQINPTYAAVHSNLGNILQDLVHFEEAIVSYRRALELDPRFAMAHNNMGNAFRQLGQMEDAIASFQLALAIEPDFAAAQSNLLFTHNYLADQLPATLLAEARKFGELAARQARPFTAWSNVPAPERALRVGFVSGDLRSHPVGYFLESVLAAVVSQASHRLELYAYSNYVSTDTVSTRIKESCRAWCLVGHLSDEALARRIRDDGIDILLDLSGHTSFSRLPVFAWKPAPVQVSWLGYFATTGVAAIDYFIADPWTLPEGEEVNFTEKIWRLPETRLCFTPPDEDVAVAPLGAPTNGYVTFGCFNHLAKMNDAVVALWARVLTAVPGSRLFLKSGPIREASVRQRISERFAVHGVSAERLILEEVVPRADYLAAYRRVDIALDPFPYPGGTTTVESLWMGVPVLTLAGASFLSRQGVGLLMNAGLPDWIAADADDYVARAVAHASDLPRLAALREGLRQQVLASSIFDAPRFAHNFEAALRGMWQRWCEQHAPTA